MQFIYLSIILFYPTRRTDISPPYSSVLCGSLSFDSLLLPISSRPSPRLVSPLYPFNPSSASSPPIPPPAFRSSSPLTGSTPFENTYHNLLRLVLTNPTSRFASSPTRLAFRSHVACVLRWMSTRPDPSRPPPSTSDARPQGSGRRRRTRPSARRSTPTRARTGRG